VRLGIDGRYITDHFPGIGRYVFNLVAELPKVAPYASFVVFHDPSSPNSRYDLGKLADHPNLKFVPTDIPTRSLREQYGMRSLVKAQELDLLHSPYYVKPYWLHCPSVVNIFDLIPLVYPQLLPHRWTSWVFRVAASLAVRRSNQIIALSESTRRDLTRLLGASQGEISVVHAATDERFRPLGKEQWQPILDRHDLPTRYIMYLGINKPHKNLIFLLRAFSRLRTDATLVLAGKEDPRYAQAREEVRRLGVTERVLFLGDIADSDLPALYNGALLFAFPSLYEGFGLPALEAMACGTPVVCSNTSSLEEILGDAAITLDPQDADAWVEALTEALENGKLRAELRAKGLARARTFSWEKAARETIGVYQSVLSR
jgi:glycosyltransferase involved in cell wall biosynthesis